MGLGSVLVLGGMLLKYIGLAIAIPLQWLLAYEIGVINFFSHALPAIPIPYFGVVGFIIYYSVLIAFILFMRHKMSYES